MKKIITVAAIMLLASCTEQTIFVKMKDGEVITIIKPEVEIPLGDSIIVKTSMGALSSHESFYGFWEGELPYNPQPCTTYKRSDSTESIFCVFYNVGVVIK